MHDTHGSPGRSTWRAHPRRCHALCALQVGAAVLVWRRRPSGAVLTLVSVALGAVFWWGFALPFGPVLGVLAVVLVPAGWPALAQTPR